MHLGLNCRHPSRRILFTTTYTRLQEEPNQNLLVEGEMDGGIQGGRDEGWELDRKMSGWVEWNRWVEWVDGWVDGCIDA